ncbi:hypothetical protein C7271_05015 [filamentous cyanobacterium CCP5]|nr:hypothetical protein C7271_05015 [filamentous cyanobacterium CCP5]
MLGHIKFRDLLPAAVAAAGAVLGSSVFASAQAATFSLTPFTGSQAEVSISLDELSDGNINVSVAANPDVALVDLRGIFFNVANPAILPQLNVINASPHIVDFKVKAGDLIEIGSKNNKVAFQGEPDLNPCLAGDRTGCDGALLIGTSGIGKDDVQSVNWTFTRRDGAPLTLADFEGMAWGVRATSVGPEGSREGSSKLSGILSAGPNPTEVPEPAGAAALVSTAAAGIVLRRRSKSSV